MEKSSKFDLVKRQKNKTLEISHQQNNVVISQEAINPPHELNETLVILSYKVNWKLGYRVAESNGSRKEWKRAWFGNQGELVLLSPSFDGWNPSPLLWRGRGPGRGRERRGPHRVKRPALPWSKPPASRPFSPPPALSSPSPLAPLSPPSTRRTRIARFKRKDSLRNSSLASKVSERPKFLFWNEKTTEALWIGVDG